MNLTTNEIISSNSSFVQNENTVTTSTVSSVKEEPEQDYWPNWVRQCMCISHLCLAFNSSVNFYIYYIKRKALNPSQSSKYLKRKQYILSKLLFLIIYPYLTYSLHLIL